MKEGLFIKYKLLLYSLVTLVVGIAILIETESNYYGWCILSISFGYLVTYLAQLVENKKLKTVLNILSFAVPGLFLIYGLGIILFHLPIY